MLQGRPTAISVSTGEPGWVASNLLKKGLDNCFQECPSLDLMGWGQSWGCVIWQKLRHNGPQLPCLICFSFWIWIWQAKKHNQQCHYSHFITLLTLLFAISYHRNFLCWHSIYCHNTHSEAGVSSTKSCLHLSRHWSDHGIGCQMNRQFHLCQPLWAGASCTHRLHQCRHSSLSRLISGRYDENGHCLMSNLNTSNSITFTFSFFQTVFRVFVDRQK